MNINGQDVKVTLREDGTVLYRYFASSIDDHKEAFWKNKYEEFIKENGEFFMTAMSATLWHTYYVTIDSILVDMWWGISLHSDSRHFYIESNNAEYGLLAALEIIMKLPLEYGDDKDAGTTPTWKVT